MSYRVFVSHGAEDTWIAEQFRQLITQTGAEAFLDVKDIPKGADFKAVVRGAVSESNELVALFTPWSAKRAWVWTEIGAAWGKEKPVIAVFHGMWISDLRDGEQGAAVLEEINAVRLNDFDSYVEELRRRVGEKKTS